MIAVKKTSAPSIMDHSVFKKIKAGLKKYYALSQHKRRQQKPPYIRLPLSVQRKIRTELKKEFDAKCAYCESSTIVSSLGDFDHFRPKSSARGLNKEFSLDHYWTLAFNWQNMYLCCETCNRYKLNWFPVEGLRASLTQSFSQIIRNEKGLLVDPCHDNPEDHFNYEPNGMIVPKTKKGEVTIDILKLNREELVERRRREYRVLLLQLQTIPHEKLSSSSKTGLINSLIQTIERINKRNGNLEFSGMMKFFILKNLRQSSNLQDLLMKNDKGKVVQDFLYENKMLPINKKYYKEPIADSAVEKSFHQKIISGNLSKPANIIERFSIDTIEIENFKCIEKLTINFPGPNNKKEPWLMLLGENGVGKSSFLQAVTLTLMGGTYRKNIALKAEDILRHGASKGSVIIKQTDGTSAELHFNKTSIQNNIKKPPSYLLAYGSTRLFPSKLLKPERTKGMVRAKNLFNPEVALYAENWLISLYENKRSQFDFAARALRALLSKELKDDSISFDVQKNEIVIVYSSGKKSPDKLRTLSDGYKSVIALACDIMQALMQSNSTMEVAEGIVLIDEIGTHLHPKWKMRVVQSLREAFPKLQFIVTTHDPLCLKGLKAGEVAVFNKTNEGKIYTIENLPDPGEYTAEQLLASNFFGLSSTIDDDLEKDFNEYYDLISKKDSLTIRQEKRLKTLKEKLRNKKHLGSSLREELALNAADILLARGEKEGKTLHVENLKEQTVAILQEFWSKPAEEQKKLI